MKLHLMSLCIPRIKTLFLEPAMTTTWPKSQNIFHCILYKNQTFQIEQNDHGTLFVTINGRKNGHYQTYQHVQETKKLDLDQEIPTYLNIW